ncbi:MAG: PhzF family phenazine biosynthesis protein [Candidatus Eremiobacteraeota bacterium]|nr:PhzF family phenazine biosynthesis protein [Candidatus Eremiobacteraeota bacterium]
MTTARYILLDVFAERAFEGNQLAIFPDCEIDDLAMQRVARELNLAETVFLTRGGTDAAASLRIFTPGREVAFAGHPTIGTAIAMVEELQWIDPGTNAFVLRERVGDIAISIERAAVTTAWLQTPETRFGSMISRDVAAAMLRLESDTVRDDVTPQVAGAGSTFLYVPLRSKVDVDRAEIDEPALRTYVGTKDIVGVYLFAQGDDGAYTRMFAPMSGIAEDPATGSAAGPLYALLARHHALPRREHFVNEQGVLMGRRSVIQIRCVWDGQHLTRVDVGGNAVIVGRGELNLPGTA